MAKKSFKNELNPALQFISSATEETYEARTEAREPAPAGYKVDPKYIETKSKRLQLLIQPSLLDALKRTAKAEGRSVNDLVHTILVDAMREEQ